jgi:hypothetical protein
LIASLILFLLREIAAAQGAQRLPPWVSSPTTPLPFFLVWRGAGRAKPGKREMF